MTREAIVTIVVTVTAAWPSVPSPLVSRTNADHGCFFVQAPPAHQFQALPPPLVVTETAFEIAVETQTVTYTEHHTQTLPTKTVTVPAPANTRLVASPAPESFKKSTTPSIPRTTTVERVVEEVVEAPSPPIVEEYEEEEAYPRVARPRRSPNSWFGW